MSIFPFFFFYVRWRSITNHSALNSRSVPEITHGSLDRHHCGTLQMGRSLYLMSFHWSTGLLHGRRLATQVVLLLTPLFYDLRSHYCKLNHVYTIVAQEVWRILLGQMLRNKLQRNACHIPREHRHGSAQVSLRFIRDQIQRV